MLVHRPNGIVPFYVVYVSWQLIRYIVYIQGRVNHGAGGRQQLSKKLYQLYRFKMFSLLHVYQKKNIITVQKQLST